MKEDGEDYLYVNKTCHVPMQWMFAKQLTLKEPEILLETGKHLHICSVCTSLFASESPLLMLKKIERTDLGETRLSYVCLRIRNRNSMNGTALHVHIS